MRKFTVLFLLGLALLACFLCSCQSGGDVKDSAPVTPAGANEIEIFGHLMRADTTAITFSGDEIPSITALSEKLKLLTELEKADLGSFHMFEEEMRLLEEEFPGVAFEYVPYVSVAGRAVPDDAESLDLEGCSGYDPELLKQELSALRNLKSVTFGKDPLPADRLAQLKADFPQIEFTAVAFYTLDGKNYREDATELDFSGSPVAEDLTDFLKKFPFLEAVNLHDTGIERRQLLELKAAYPDLLIKAEVELAGELFATESEELDLNSKIIRDYEQFSESLALFDRLSRVELCDCGLSNEQLAALRDIYPNTKFVWRVYLGKWSLRTDAVAFSVLITTFDYVSMTEKDIEVLKYCTDLQALDLGHQAISDLSVIGEYLTDLRVLILADNLITDLSPLANLPHLHYLEFFMNDVTDLTPLVQCRELVDLNISYNPHLSDITPLLDLPLLERLWMVSVPVSQENTDLLRETCPDLTLVNTGSGSTGSGWREHARYFAMIDMYRKTDYISEEFSKYDGMG